MFDNKLLFFLIGVTCIAPLLAQQGQYCRTPDNYYGTCVVLSYCPQVVNIFQRPSRQATEYAFALQRSCGTRSFNGDPIVCCTQPYVDQSQEERTTQRNPFLPVTKRPAAIKTTTMAIKRTTTVRTTPAPVTSAPITAAPLINSRGPYCRDPDIREGECIELKLCPSLVEQLQVKHTDEVFVNYLRASNRICGAVGSVVCCPISQAPTTAAPVRVANSGEIPRRLPTANEGCGYTTSSYKKIVGGEVSKKGAWPWIALLGYEDDLSDSPFKCGGTLVTARHVVTAAHCILDSLNFVRLGEHDLTTDTEAKHVDINIARKESHPEYNRRNGRSDIAMVFLERNVVFTDFITPICMPTTPELRAKSYVRFMPFVIGWGRTQEGGASSNILQELQIPIYDNEVCRTAYRNKNREFTADQFDKATLCAGVLSGGKDTCQGDSGGPLMIPEQHANSVRYYLIGVVSYGIGCARPDVPGVYTSIQFFMDWIVDQVANTQ